MGCHPETAGQPSAAPESSYFYYIQLILYVEGRKTHKSWEKKHGSCEKWWLTSARERAGGLMCCLGSPLFMHTRLSALATWALVSTYPVLLDKERNNDIPLIVLWELVQIKALSRAITDHFKADLRVYKTKDKPGILTYVFALSSLKHTELDLWLVVHLVVKYIGNDEYQKDFLSEPINKSKFLGIAHLL